MIVNREWDTLFYLDVLCMNGHECLEQTCSPFIGDLLFEYPHNAQFYGIEENGCEYSLLFGCFYA